MLTCERQVSQTSLSPRGVVYRITTVEDRKIGASALQQDYWYPAEQRASPLWGLCFVLMNQPVSAGFS